MLIVKPTAALELMASIAPCGACHLMEEFSYWLGLVRDGRRVWRLIDCLFVLVSDFFCFLVELCQRAPELG